MFPEAATIISFIISMITDPLQAPHRTGTIALLYKNLPAIGDMAKSLAAKPDGGQRIAKDAYIQAQVAQKIVNPMQGGWQRALDGTTPLTETAWEVRAGLSEKGVVGKWAKSA